jgi:hypothetical protein
MRTLMVTAAAVLVFSVQLAASAKAEDNPILRKDNDAGASSTVIKNDEPPITPAPAPRDRDQPDTQHGGRAER